MPTKGSAFCYNRVKLQPSVGRRSVLLELPLRLVEAVTVGAEVGLELLGVAAVGIAEGLQRVVDLVAKIEVDARDEDGGVVGKIIHGCKVFIGVKRETDGDGYAGKQKKIEIGLLAEINLAAQDAHRAEHGHDNGGETYVNHHFVLSLIMNNGVRKSKRACWPQCKRLIHKEKQRNGSGHQQAPVRKAECKGSDRQRDRQRFSCIK